MRISVLATTLASGALLTWMISFGSGPHSLYADDGPAPPNMGTGAIIATAAGLAGAKRLGLIIPSPEGATAARTALPPEPGSAD